MAMQALQESFGGERYPAPRLGRPQVFSQRIPKGFAGTQQTVGRIRELIRAGAKDFYVRQKAIDILLAHRVRPKDYLGEIKALFEWVQHHVRYTKDPFRVEVLHTAPRMLALRAGDCDDMTILLGAMLESIGHPVRLVLTGPDPLRPRFFSHIYLEVQHKGRWIPLDPTMRFPMGWAPRTWTKTRVALREEDVNPTRYGTATAGAVEDTARKDAQPFGCGDGQSRAQCACCRRAAETAPMAQAKPQVAPNDLPQQVARAVTLARRFHGYTPARAARVRHTRWIPPVVVGLGDLLGFIYRSDKGRPGRPRNFIHFMRRPAQLASNAQGTQLYVIGGNYRVTPRGIEG
jgi:hypothetical protein